MLGRCHSTPQTFVLLEEKVFGIIKKQTVSENFPYGLLFVCGDIDRAVTR